MINEAKFTEVLQRIIRGIVSIVRPYCIEILYI